MAASHLKQGFYKMSNITVLKPEKPIELSAAQLQLVKNTVAKECNEDEFNLFIAVCKRVGLDPFRRQIYAVVYNADKPEKRSMTLMTSIGGLQAIADRSGTYRPDENNPEYTMDKELISPSNPLGILKVEVFPQKYINGEWHQLAGEAYWDEFAPVIDGYDEVDKGATWQDGNPKMTRVPNGKDMLDPRSKFWSKMPRRMIAKCAEAQALRKGWPEDLSGLYSPEEMDQQNSRIASEEMEELEINKRLEAINSQDALSIQWHVTDIIESVPAGKFMDKAIEFVSKSESPIELNKWKERNRYQMQEFWARHKSDALELKKAIEQKMKELGGEQ